MAKVFHGYTTTKARASLDALWALVLLSGCGETPATPTVGPAPSPMHFGHTRIKANADLDAMWDVLPGAIPADPDPDGRRYVGYASTSKYANLDALVAAIAPFQCCVVVPPPPPACLKILDEDFTGFVDAAAFLASWQARSSLISAPTLAAYDIAVSAQGTRLTLKSTVADQTPNTFYELDFIPGVTPSARAPVWMRMRARLDAPNPTTTLDNAQQQLALGARQIAQSSEWFAFAVDTYVGGPFYSAIHARMLTDQGTANLGGEVDGFPWEAYFDDLATEWDMVAHMQFNEDGTGRLRTFIGPSGGVQVPISDVIAYVPLLDHGDLAWAYHSHKSDGGLLSAPMMVRAEAYECPYESNPFAVQLVLPSGAPTITSLAITPPSMILDDELELGVPVTVTAKDAANVEYPGVLPLLYVDDTADFATFWRTVHSRANPASGVLHAVWPGELLGGSGGALGPGGGVVSNAVALDSFFQVARRYWFIRSDSPANGRVLSIAALQLRLTTGGADISNLGTPIGSAPLAGTSLADAFDGNAATFFTATGAPGTQFIGIDFGAGNAKLIRQIAITARNDGQHGLAPAHFSIYSSDDLALIAQHQPYTRTQWTSGQTKTFSVF